MLPQKHRYAVKKRAFFLRKKKSMKIDFENINVVPFSITATDIEIDCPFYVGYGSRLGRNDGKFWQKYQRYCMALRPVATYYYYNREILLIGCCCQFGIVQPLQLTKEQLRAIIEKKKMFLKLVSQSKRRRIG